MAKDILIVDDDKQICKILGQFCKNMGCFTNIVLAHDGAMAAAKLNNQKFDVIILDINLPKRSGIDVLKEIAENKQSVNDPANIIVISGSMEKDKMEKILAYKCRNFLVKPFDEASFQEKVLKILQTPPAPVTPPKK
ncbi:MAG: response regulator [Bacteriovorax sp.]|nr:response regulator [Bacteriovorax sp.]